MNQNNISHPILDLLKFRKTIPCSFTDSASGSNKVLMTKDVTDTQKLYGLVSVESCTLLAR